MEASWWTRVGLTAFLAVVGAVWLVWTVGGWSTDAELQGWEARKAQLEAELQSAEPDGKPAAEAALSDHLAKAPAAEDGTGGGTSRNALRRPPGWARTFPQQKISLGLDLQGGIDLELQVDLRKALEVAADRGAADLPRVLLDEAQIAAEAERVEGTAQIIVFVPEDARERARSVISERSGAVWGYLGVDEVGGKEGLRYGLQDAYAANLKTTARDQAVETIRNRIDKFGVTEPAILTKGEDRIAVQLPGLDDPQRAIDLVGRTAQLEFRMLHKEAEWSDSRVQAVVDRAVQEAGLGDFYNDTQLARALAGKIPAEAEVLFEKEYDELQKRQVRRRALLVNRRVELSGDMVKYASVASDQFNQPYVRLELNDEGGRIFAKLSGDNIGKRMAIILDGTVASAPVFNERIPGGVASITMGGDSDRGMREAQDLSVVLRAGALPAPIEILHNRTVGQTLGADSVQAGKVAATVGALLVLLFMALYYRGAGLIANVAVALNITLLLACLAAFGATLTLPGIAGIVLTIGMAVDANVIIYERIREELREGKSARAALAAGYEKATWTILDANITTFITGAVLYSYGSGPIKGFAVTLMIGIVSSVFTGLVVTRLILDWLVHGRGARTISIGI